jgi:hypothetical protein
MASIINSTTTSPGGLISTGDSSNSLLIQTGDTTAITINGSQVVSLTNPLPVASGGTGASSNSAAPFALKGANSDITSLSGLTTALSVAQGGTGANTATAAFNALNPMTTTGDILYEASPTTAARLGIGSSGQVLTVSGGVPAWTTISAGLPGLTGQVFTSSGTFTVPTGVTRVKVTMCGGGGAGSFNGNGNSGGTTSFGAFVSASGGTAGGTNTGGGGGGTSGADFSATGGNGYAGTSTCYGVAYGGGGGVGGASGLSYSSNGAAIASPPALGLLGGTAGQYNNSTTATGYGNGGACDSTNQVRGGGAGGYAIKFVTGLTPGGTVSVTIGSAGTNGNDSRGNGRPGICIVEW